MFRERDINQGNGDNGNGHMGVVESPHESESVFVDDGPEIVSAATHDEERDLRSPLVVNEEGDIAHGVETERGQKIEGRGRKRAVGAMFVMALLVLGAIAAYFMVGNGSTKKARVPVNGAGQNNSQQSDDVLTRQALDNVKTPGVNVDGATVRPQVTGTPEQSQAITNEPTQLPANFTATVGPSPAVPQTSSDTQSQQSSQSSTIAKAVAPSERNGERSVRIGEESTALSREPAKPDRNDSDRTVRAGVAVPSFGSMLPVRSLGAIFTLRSGSLARFELTRDVKGKGWFLPHGTVLVGALRGAEFDRAFISLVGFIDNDSGKFVKVTGDVLGPDGGSGVKGKRRKMTSSWSKVLAKMGEAGLNIAGGLASSVGHRPVIISDAFGSVGYRVTNEFDGVLTNKDKNTFVEVGAGANCYVMITELPESIQGVDALSKFSGREVEDKADSDQRRDSTGMSERELAELMQSNDPEKVRAALPRMTPEMRRVAEAVLAGDDK